MFKCLNGPYLPSIILNVIEKNLYENQSELIQVDTSPSTVYLRHLRQTSELLHKVMGVSR
jgi:hypothetical protein